MKKTVDQKNGTLRNGRTLHRAGLMSILAVSLPLSTVARAVIPSAAPQPSVGNAIGCFGASGGVFAGRYEAIYIFADLERIAARHPAQATVVGKISAGLLPEALSMFVATWSLDPEPEQGTMLLQGTGQRPDGNIVRGTLRLPVAEGVHDSVFETHNQTTGEISRNEVVCTVKG